MWLFTRVGFFSVVDKGAPGTLVVRARARDDLDRLRQTFAPSLGPMIEGAGTDYPYRAIIAREALASAMAALVSDIDYANFKDEIARKFSKERVRVHSKVWSAASSIADAPRDSVIDLTHIDLDAGLPPQPEFRRQYHRPMPAQQRAMSMRRTFTPAEVAKLQFGLHAGDEVRWSVYTIDDVVYMHRSWTGNCIYELKLEYRSSRWRITSLVVNDDAAEYEAGRDDVECERVERVLGLCFEHIPEQVEPAVPPSQRASEIMTRAEVEELMGEELAADFYTLVNSGKRKRSRKQ